jgi:hypothetical protein
MNSVMLADRQMTEMKQKEERHKLETERLANEKKLAEDFAKQQIENVKAVKAAAQESHKRMQETLEKQHQIQIEQLKKQMDNQVQNCK